MISRDEVIAMAKKCSDGKNFGDSFLERDRSMFVKIVDKAKEAVPNNCEILDKQCYDMGIESLWKGVKGGMKDAQ